MTSLSQVSLLSSVVSTTKTISAALPTSTSTVLHPFMVLSPSLQTAVKTIHEKKITMTYSSKALILTNSAGLKRMQAQKTWKTETHLDERSYRSLGAASGRKLL